MTATYIDPTTNMATTTMLSDSFAFYNSGTSVTIGGLPPQFQDGLGFSLTGVSQLYSGPENTPTFIAGTYSGSDPDPYSGSDPTFGNTGVLTITTPEPSSVLIYFAGFLTLAGFLLLRKVQG